MNLYRKILERFPRGNLSYVFAYGSGVKHQFSSDGTEIKNKNVIDMVFCVKDPLGWHAENIKRHPHHYSALKNFGPRFIMNYQERFGAGVYFNTLIPLHDLDVTVKYGVVTREHLMEDLLHWRHLYLAGRLQKPVTSVVPATHDDELVKALAKNLISALQVALLMLPQKFTAYELFHTICNLSYRGDFRMIFGENKQKARNIVLGQQQEFLKLYEPALRCLQDYIAIDLCSKDPETKQPIIKFEQNNSFESKEYHLRTVPSRLRKYIEVNAAFKGNYADIVKQLAATSNVGEIVNASVNDIVWRSSITQSIKNIPSAGIIKSIIYSSRKALKTFEN